MTIQEFTTQLLENNDPNEEIESLSIFQQQIEQVTHVCEYCARYCTETGVCGLHNAIVELNATCHYHEEV